VKWLSKFISCRHSDDPVATSYGQLGMFPAAPTTYLLWRCKHCGRVWSQMLQGKWTMADITGQGRIKIVNTVMEEGDEKWTATT
jgi:hypothetical protein